jgi:hypothetical protein
MCVFQLILIIYVPGSTYICWKLYVHSLNKKSSICSSRTVTKFSFLQAERTFLDRSPKLVTAVKFNFSSDDFSPRLKRKTNAVSSYQWKSYKSKSRKSSLEARKCRTVFKNKCSNTLKNIRTFWKSVEHILKKSVEHILKKCWTHFEKVLNTFWKKCRTHFEKKMSKTCENVRTFRKSV